jgi:hypothetical protein
MKELRSFGGHLRHLLAFDPSRDRGIVHGALLLAATYTAPRHVSAADALRFPTREAVMGRRASVAGFTGVVLTI